MYAVFVCLVINIFALLFFSHFFKLVRGTQYGVLSGETRDRQRITSSLQWLYTGDGGDDGYWLIPVNGYIVYIYITYFVFIIYVVVVVAVYVIMPILQLIDRPTDRNAVKLSRRAVENISDEVHKSMGINIIS